MQMTVFGRNGERVLVRRGPEVANRGTGNEILTGQEALFIDIADKTIELDAKGAEAFAYALLGMADGVWMTNTRAKGERRR